MALELLKSNGEVVAPTCIYVDRAAVNSGKATARMKALAGGRWVLPAREAPSKPVKSVAKRSLNSYVMPKLPRLQLVLMDSVTKEYGLDFRYVPCYAGNQGH